MTAWVMCFVLLYASVGEDRAKVAADLDAREQRLESLYADYWRTEYKIAMGVAQYSRRGRFKNKFVPLSPMILSSENLDRTSFSDRAPEGKAQAVSQ